ncbi:putative membrane protein [Erwinia phage pEa_SNUABM_50]|uniref:Uncharacterized protein n=4 Tax=Eneladusvirus BF TaxID=2560751 RepID=A0A1S6UBF2_9CAUD|nr:membrane protein [Serratia phage BF]QOI71414.1 putative membrane protein [Erwinia phage pEa_SNUABM_12]QOI72009.1 putative membrane protein [Erwinia phage pEa_SNUABM_47]QOI72549.1 putative membrane protein [Erwinia phage pEa_SNUABM_50]QXO11682.1 hypothetical protein pEaSNUABM19_00571 [Erwinia phage pEa_SNUABM_19]QXO12231.1 hypothetical protein pEaSNUABM44_00570 [Erwinia phage pEa_SNUABM_44]QXO12785.1 hypothetical protein pEaSNUABM49_00572 [Erwinia phage pEa_SNUABM_49]
MSIWEWVVQNSIVLTAPLFLYITLYAFTTITWLFATDFYDSFKYNYSNNFGMFHTLLWGGLATIPIGYYWTWVNPFTFIINGYISLILIVIFIAKIHSTANSIHQYFRSKRGK